MMHTRKYLILASLYIAQSVPLSFLKTGFQSFLRSQDLQYDNISRMIGMMMLPWVIKFLWAPLVDKWCANRLPRMRNAILFFQLMGALILGFIASMSFPDALRPITLMFFIFSFIAATQDIVVDGLAVLTLPQKEHGFGNILQIGGYYLGEVLGGALILIIFDQFGWNWAMGAFVVFFMLPFIPVLLFRAGNTGEIPPAGERMGLRKIREFFGLPGMRIWIAVMVIFMGIQVLPSTLLPSLLTDKGFGKSEIGSVIGIWNNTASLAGAVIGGLLINKLGRKNSLIVFGLLKIAASLTFFLLNAEVVTRETAYWVISVNGFASGLATVTIYTIMMDKCRLSSPGTDFTIQQCINHLSIVFYAIISGILVNRYQGSFTGLFYTATAIGIAGVLITVFGVSHKSLDSGKIVSEK